MGYTDANGIYHHQELDPADPGAGFSALLNLTSDSVSDAVPPLVSAALADDPTIMDAVELAADNLDFLLGPGTDERFRFINTQGQVAFEVDENGNTHTAQEAPDRVELLFEIGQSNMAGRGHPYDERDFQHSRAYMFDWGTRTVLPSTIPLSTQDAATRYGLGNVWPRLILEEAGDRTAVVNINAAVGSTSLLLANDRPNGVWHPNYAGSNPHLLQLAFDAYDDALAAVTAAWPSAKVSTWIMWHQGEADAADGATVADYKTALKDLIVAVRTHVGDSQAPVVSGGIVPGNGFLPDAENVRVANIETATEIQRMVYVEGIDNGGGSAGPSDSLHYSREALDRLALDMWTGAKRAASADGDSFSHAPLDVTATRVGDVVTASWSAPWTRWTRFDLDYSTDDGATWTSVTRTVPASQSETFTTTAGTLPVWVRVRTVNTGATEPNSKYTTPVLALRG